jgi:hypothetical protein
VVVAGGIDIGNASDGDVELVLGIGAEVDVETEVWLGGKFVTDTGRGGNGGLGFDRGDEYGGGTSLPTVNPSDCPSYAPSLPVNPRLRLFSSFELSITYCSGSGPL